MAAFSHNGEPGSALDAEVKGHDIRRFEGYTAGFKAGREQGMREAAAIVHSREMAKEIAMQVRPYEPISAENVALLMEDCHDACVAIHRAILAAIEGKK